MKRILLGLLVVVTACTSATSGQTSPSPRITDVPAATASPSDTPAPTIVAPSPTAPAPPAPTELPRLVNVDVTVAPGVFPILTTLRAGLGAIDERVINAARAGVEVYLQNIDMYRRGESSVLPITGPFLAAVSSALKESATPGVKREFKIQSLVVDRHVQKPWGPHAYVEVTVSLVDRAIDGSAPDQFETGKLRLTGDRLRVSDGWDEENGRWFNGFAPLPLDRVRTEIVDPTAFFLRLDSWAPGYAVEQWRTSGDEVTPFTKARATRYAAIDRTRTVAQSFSGVTATIEQFETIQDIWSGLATVRLNGTRVTSDAAGVVRRTPFERRVRVFLFGLWVPEVVDEEVLPGVWLSGGELALEKVDIDRA